MSSIERNPKRCFENALSNKSKCRKCNFIIKKNIIRFGESKDEPNLQEGWFWYHLKCISVQQKENFETIYDDYKSIPGYNDFKIEKQNEINSYFEDKIDNEENIKSLININKDTSINDNKILDIKKRKRKTLETNSNINKDSKLLQDHIERNKNNNNIELINLNSKKLKIINSTIQKAKFIR